MKKQVIIYYSIILILVGAFFPAIGNAIDAETVLENHKQSIISFVAMNDNKQAIARGSGFLIGKEILVTTYHLLSQAKEAEGLNYKGKKVKFEGFISTDKSLDLAVVKVKSKENVLQFGSMDELKFDKEIFVLGGNDAGELRAYDGKIMEVYEFGEAKKVVDSTLVASDSFCGGPVVDAEGKVLGIMMFLDGSKSFILPAEYARALTTTGSVMKFKDQTPLDYLETPEGINLAGKVYAAMNDTGRAEKYLRKIVQMNPNDIQAQLILADVYTEQRDYTSAVSTYKKILELQPTRDDMLMKLGEVYLKRRDWKDAIAALEKAISMNPQNSMAYFNIGSAYQEIQDFTKAIEAYEKYLQSSPVDLKDTNARLGECLFQTEQYEKAAVAFENALELSPQDLRINYKLAQSLQKSGAYDKAAEKFFLLAELSPDDASIYYNNVVVMFDEAKMPEKAVEAASKVAALKPNDADAQYNHGFMLVKMKKYAEAIEAFKKTAELRPDFEYAWLQIGYCYNQLKKYNESIAAYKKLVEINPDNDNSWMNIAIGYMQQRKWDAAIPSLRKTIELNPKNGTAYYNLAIVYLNLKDTYSATEVYNQLKKIDAGLAQRLLKYFK